MNLPPNDPHPDTLQRTFEQVHDLAAADARALRLDRRLLEHLGQAHAQYLAKYTAEYTLKHPATRQRPIVWRHVADKRGKSYFEIGREGEPLVAFHTGERCVWWLWKAIDDKGVTNTLRARDFAAPHAAEPDASARQALHKTAPQWLVRRFPELGDDLKLLARRVIVENGLIHFMPGPHTPRISTR